jgi:succinate dehydrogenase / fumarate reductase iron-sulfur subunit
MSESERKRIDACVQCILCGVCYAACPARTANEAFAGPAALAKLHRFLVDSREDRNGHTLRPHDSQQGVWGCRTIRQCVRACPKDVRPADGIRGVRRELAARKLKRLLGRKTP